MKMLHSDTEADMAAAAARQAGELAATAPVSARHLVIHMPNPASTWPSHIESVSPLYRAMRGWKRDEDLRGVTYTISDGARGMAKQSVPWNPQQGRLDEPSADADEPEYEATVYPEGKRLKVSTATLPAFEEDLRSLILDGDDVEPTAPGTSIYVCTHGTRDCRCGETGEAVYLAIEKELRARGWGGTRRETDDNARVTVSRVAHIGGHKWAGNVLVYRKGEQADWYGYVTPDVVSELLDRTVEKKSVWWQLWRGRVGASQGQMQDEYEDGIASSSS